MKQKYLICLSLVIFLIISIIFLISSFSLAYAQNKIDYQLTLYEREKVSIQKAIPPSISDISISPEHASDKIIEHGYALIDAYIDELKEITCQFPNSSFEFRSYNETRVEISPTCFVDSEIRRMIQFSYPDGSAQITFLDGPIPGTRNEEAIQGTKDTLEDILVESKMMVKVVYKNGPTFTFNLSTQEDFQSFIDLMYDSIVLSHPIFNEEPASVFLTKGIPIPRQSKL